MAKEREREIQRLEAERRRHMERVMRDQKKEDERRLREAARLRQMQVGGWRGVGVGWVGDARPENEDERRLRKAARLRLVGGQRQGAVKHLGCMCSARCARGGACSRHF